MSTDVAAMAAAIDADTIMLVGSAPYFSFGVIDPLGREDRCAHIFPAKTLRWHSGWDRFDPV